LQFIGVFLISIAIKFQLNQFSPNDFKNRCTWNIF